MKYKRNNFIKLFTKLLNDELDIKVAEDPIYKSYNGVVEKGVLVDKKYRCILSSIANKLINKYDNLNLIDILFNNTYSHHAFRQDVIYDDQNDNNRTWKELSQETRTHIIMKLVHNDNIDIITSGINADPIYACDTTLKKAFNTILHNIAPDNFISYDNFEHNIISLSKEYLNEISKLLIDNYSIKLLEDCSKIHVFPNALEIEFELAYKDERRSLPFKFTLYDTNIKNAMYEYVTNKHKVINTLTMNNPKISWYTQRCNIYDRYDIHDYEYVSKAVSYLIDYMMNNKNFIKTIVINYLKYNFSPAVKYKNITYKMHEYIVKPQLTIDDILTYIKYVIDTDAVGFTIEPVCSIYK